MRPLTRQEEQDMDIQRLSDQYQEQLADLNAAHSLLTVDQQRLADMLYVDSSGGVTGMLSEDVRLFKDGLDFRLKEFEESCNRIQDIERRLQEIDQVRFEKVMLEEETKRLRDMTMGGQVAAVQAARAAGRDGGGPVGGRAAPLLHAQREATRAAPPIP